MKELSVVNTSQGLYWVNCLQMGMKNASAIFQRVMELKSIELVDEISFLGFWVSARGIEPDQELANKIKMIKQPESKAEVEQFVGLVNYFGRLIPNLSAKLAPVNELRKKNVPFEWTMQCSDAFELLKNEISTAPVVQPYSLEKEATLTTGASQGSVAAVHVSNTFRC